MTYVSFPGLFEKIFEINPIIFPDFPLQIRWYGLIICTGILLALFVATRNAKKEGISTDSILDFGIFTIPFAIIGARLYYVITSPDEYNSFYDVIAIWNGGLAIYGAVIVGAVTVFVIAKIKKIKFSKIADVAAPSLLLGQLIGRWGNFCNGEAFGHLDRIEFLGKIIETPSFEDNYLLRMVVSSNATNGEFLTVHPTFLYESLWNLIGFIIISLIYKKKKFDGQIVLSYFAWYGFGRFFIEGLRSDSLYLWNSDIKISQLFALLTFVFATIALIVILARQKSALKDAGEYESQFAVSTNAADSEKAIGEEANKSTKTQTEGTDNGNTD